MISVAATSSLSTDPGGFPANRQPVSDRIRDVNKLLSEACPARRQGDRSRILHSSIRGFALLGLIALQGCDRPGASLPDFSRLVEENTASVVNISTVASAVDVPNGNIDGESPTWFRKYLEDQAPDGASAGPAGPEPLGSGFVLWEDGYVLTNYHVIRGAQEIVVRMLDRRQMNARIVGVDPSTDLALLQIEADNLPAVKVGRSGSLKAGQWVFAIGSPFSFDHSVTAGIVSAVGRNLQSEQYVPFIQTDVAINPGNSGGPLFNLQGQVVGINSQIYSQSGSFQGVSFAIPIELAVKVAEQLRHKGRVTRGWLGVVVQPVDRALANSFGMDKAEGALVAKVVEGSPAFESGIRTGDVILSFNRVALDSSGGLPPLVGSVDPGQVVPLELVRDGKVLGFRVEIGLLDEEPQQGLEDHAAQVPDVAPPGSLGLTVRELSDEERAAKRVLTGGVVIDKLEGGAALEAGLREGDVILSIAGQEVDSAQGFQDVARRLTPGTTVPLLVSRAGAPSFLPLKVPSAPGKRFH